MKSPEILKRNEILGLTWDVKSAAAKIREDVTLLVMRGLVSSMPKYQPRNPILEDRDDDDENEREESRLIGREISEFLIFLSW